MRGRDKDNNGSLGSAKKARGDADAKVQEVEETIPKLWPLLCSSQVRKEETRVGTFLSCPEGAYWFQLIGLKIKDLLIRECYEDLYNLWKDSPLRVQFIAGSSGIGKSTFIWYALFRLFEAHRASTSDDKEELTIVWVTQEKLIYVLTTDGGCRELDNLRPAFPAKADYCFVDMGMDFTPPPRLYALHTCEKLRTLIVASPKSAEAGLPKLRDVFIRPFSQRYMPVWTYEEMHCACARIFGRPGLDETRLRALYHVFGGSLNFCLGNLAEIGEGSSKGSSSFDKYGTARDEFVAFLKTSRELVKDGIPNAVEALLNEPYIKSVFIDIQRVFTGAKGDPILRAAGSILVHTRSSPPEYMECDIRVSSRFCEHFMYQFFPF